MTDPTPESVKVVSPATLEGGATFEAEVDGKTFMVTVPDGGVGEGDNFDVPYPADAAIPIAVAAIAVPVGTTDVAAAVANKNEVGAFVVPTGSWRHDLCSCFESCCCPFMMGWCCFPILMGQTMQRMKMNFFGGEKSANENQAPICIVYTAITVGIFVLGLILSRVIPDLFYILWILWGLYLTIVFTCARMTMRKKYKIEPGCCGDNCLDDCCNVYFCTCCTAIQMARHTHDENDYHYNCTSQTGLDDDAPEIV